MTQRADDGQQPASRADAGTRLPTPLLAADRRGGPEREAVPEAYARISHETRRHLESELAGVGAVAQVLVQLVPSLWDPVARRHLDPAVSGGLVVGLVVMYLTGLLVVA